jgi:glucokinase
MKEEFAIGFDIGGTKLEAGVVDSTGNMRERIVVATDIKSGSEGIEKQIKTIFDQLTDKGKRFNPVGFGIGVAGQVEAKTGKVKYAPNLNWHDVPLLVNLRASLQIPGIVTNDVRAAAWGEWMYGAGKNNEDIVVLFIGTGIGGGVVSGGKMLSGFSNTGGELGHIMVKIDGPNCSCGNKGCLEAFAGGRSIAQRAKQILTEEHVDSLILKFAGHSINSITAEIVIQAYKVGDIIAERIIQDAQSALIAGGISIVNAFNPSVIIMGGGIVKGLPELVRKTEEGIKQHALFAATKDLKVVPAKLQIGSGVIGAAAIAIHAFGKSRYTKNEIIDHTA